MILTAGRIIGGRIAAAALLLVMVSMLVFAILRLLPVDPVGMSLPPNATEADRAALSAQLGLDRPVPEQYLRWVVGMAEGRFGLSIHFRRDVGDLIGAALPATIELVFCGALLGVIFGVGGGLLLFHLRGGWLEPVGDVGSSIIMSVPEFLWAILLILAFGVAWQMLPFIGRLDPSFRIPSVTGFLLIDAALSGRKGAFGDVLLHMLLPSLSLALAFAPMIARVLRSSLLSVIVEDYVTLARLRGLSEPRILLNHALKNAALPTLSLIGVQVGFMFGGTLLVEVIFGYPGLGGLMVEAVRAGDLPIIQTAALTYCVTVLLINLVVDIAYVALNPKLRPA